MSQTTDAFLQFVHARALAISQNKSPAKQKNEYFQLALNISSRVWRYGIISHRDGTVYIDEIRSGQESYQIRQDHDDAVKYVDGEYRDREELSLFTFRRVTEAELQHLKLRKRAAEAK